jgi:RNA polymerase sigma-70 factor (ECF subfamily)
MYAAAMSDWRTLAAAIGRSDAELDAVADALQALHEAGQRRWSRVRLERADLVARVAMHLPPDADCVAHLRGLFAEDLYLACACAREVDGAAEAFDSEFLVRVGSFVRHLDASPSFADEIRQLVRERVLLRRPDGPPRIGDYSGGVPMAAWLRVCAVRVALNARAEPHQARRIDDQSLLDDLADETSPELQVLRAQHAAALTEALRKAVAALPPHQRVILRMYFSLGQSTEQIATALRVNRSTAARRLVAAREAVFSETQRLLRETLPVTSSEFVSLARVLHDQLNISLRTLLGEPAETNTPGSA